MHKNLKMKLADSIREWTLPAGLGALPDPDKVLRRTGKTIEAYRELKNDPHVWSCVQSRKSGLLCKDYFIESRGATKGVTREIESIFHGLDIAEIERDILEAPLFGWQVLEIIWDDAPGARAVAWPVGIIARPHEWFRFDASGSLLLGPGNFGGAGWRVPPEKAIVASYEAGPANPYGSALLAKCYWPVTFKNGGLRLWVAFMEKYGMPLLLGRFSRGASSEEASKLASDLAEMTRDSVIVAPSDIDIDLKEASRVSSSSLYRELIRHCNSEISKAILSQTLTTELEAGSFAAAQTHYRIRREVILSDSRIVEKAFNTLIRLIININYPGSPAPRFRLAINDADNDNRLERDVKLLSTGRLNFTRQYWLDNYGFKPEEIEPCQHHFRK